MIFPLILPIIPVITDSYWPLPPKITQDCFVTDDIIGIIISCGILLFYPIVIII